MHLKPIVVLGAGGLGRETMCLIDAVNARSGTYRTLGYVDDDVSKHGQTLCGRPVLGGFDWIESFGEDGLCVALGVGEPALKYRFVERIRRYGVEFPTLVHPSAVMTDHVNLAEGVAICAGCVMTVDITIGAFTWVNLHATIGHDVRVGSYSQINPSVKLSGKVVVGDGVEIGTGVIVTPRIAVGSGTVIGAASLVARDLPENVNAIGVPAIPLKNLPPWKERHPAPA